MRVDRITIWIRERTCNTYSILNAGRLTGDTIPRLRNLRGIHMHPLDEEKHRLKSAATIIKRIKLLT